MVPIVLNDTVFLNQITIYAFSQRTVHVMYDVVIRYFFFTYFTYYYNVIIIKIHDVKLLYINHEHKVSEIKIRNLKLCATRNLNDSSVCKYVSN